MIYLMMLCKSLKRIFRYDEEFIFLLSTGGGSDDDGGYECADWKHPGFANEDHGAASPRTPGASGAMGGGPEEESWGTRRPPEAMQKEGLKGGPEGVGHCVSGDWGLATLIPGNVPGTSDARLLYFEAEGHE